MSSVALQIAAVVPVMVTIRSGVEPSEIRTLALDYNNNNNNNNQWIILEIKNFKCNFT